MVSSCWGKGIIDAEIQVVSISGTVKFKVLENDTKDFIRSCGYFVQTAAGSAITHSFIVPDANGVYELTGTGFVSGDVLSGKMVLAKVEDLRGSSWSSNSIRLCQKQLQRNYIPWKLR
jgi:hypothetical protein